MNRHSQRMIRSSESESQIAPLTAALVDVQRVFNRHPALVASGQSTLQSHDTDTECRQKSV
jgi:hypothetical protein